MCEELRVDGGTSKSRLSANPPRPPAGLAWPGLDKAWPGQGLAWTSLAWTGQGCASAARNPKGPQKPPFGHQMGRHKRWGGGLDAKFDQNFAPDLFRGLPGVISQLFGQFFDLKSGNSRCFENKSCFRLQDNQQNLEKIQNLTFSDWKTPKSDIF